MSLGRILTRNSVRGRTWVAPHCTRLACFLSLDHRLPCCANDSGATIQTGIQVTQAEGAPPILFAGAQYGDGFMQLPYSAVL